MVHSDNLPFLRQTWIASGVLMSWIGKGCTVGFGSSLLAQLRKDETAAVNLEIGSWIVSIIGFGVIPGSLLMPILMEKYGRRKSLITAAVVQSSGWILTTLSFNIYILLIARFLQGTGMGLLSAVSSIAIAEYTSPKRRGYFSIVAQAMGFSFGVLFAHAIGYRMAWKISAAICSAFPIIALMVFITTPETPYWLASKEQYDLTRKNFIWLRGYKNEEENLECEDMIAARKIENDLYKSNNSRENIFKMLCKKELLKPLFVVAHLFIMSQFVAFQVISSYADSLLSPIIGPDSNVFIWINIMDGVRFVSGGVCAILVGKFNRRSVLFCSGSSLIIIMLGMSLFSYLKMNGVIHNTWLFMILLCLYAFAVSTGVSSLPFGIAGELFPMEVKSLGYALGLTIMNTCFFTGLKTAPWLFESLHFHGAFLVYAGILIYCLFVLWFILPETKDRTLQDIEDNIKNSKFKRVPSEECEEKA